LVSVTGISHIEYVLPIARYARDKAQISRREILEVVRREAAERERIEAIFAGKGIDYNRKMKSKPLFLEGITNSLILAMKKWDLLGKATTMDLFPVPQSLRKLCVIDATEDGGLLQAKTSIYDCIMRSGKETIFEPSNLLLSIRDNSVSTIKAVMKDTTATTIEEFAISGCEGRAYNDYYFVHDKLKTNFRSFDIIRDWGYFFGLLNEYKNVPVSADIAKRIKYPQYEIYLTKTICSMYEILETIQHLRKAGRTLTGEDLGRLLGINKYSVVCIVYNLKSLGLVSYREAEIIPEEDLFKTGMSDQEILCQTIYRKVRQIGSVLVSDDPSSRGVLASIDETRKTDPKHLYLITTTLWKIEDFQRVLRQAYLRVTDGKPYRYAYIQSVRKEACRALRIHDDAFDEYLRELIRLKPELIELTKASGEITRNLLPRRSFVKVGKPFKLKGQFFRMMMIGG